MGRWCVGRAKRNSRSSEDSEGIEQRFLLRTKGYGILYDGDQGEGGRRCTIWDAQRVRLDEGRQQTDKTQARRERDRRGSKRQQNDTFWVSSDIVVQ